MFAKKGGGGTYDVVARERLIVDQGNSFCVNITAYFDSFVMNAHLFSINCLPTTNFQEIS